MPHEIFMTAVVPDVDAPKARSVLTGITETRERHRYTMIRYMRRLEAGPKSLDKLKELAKEPRNPNAARWQELHQTLLAQSYIIQERIDITPEMTNQRAGDNTTATIPPNKPRLLRWDNIPDPRSDRVPPFITQRRMLEIADANIPKYLADAKFIPKSEAVIESYHWWLNNIEYVLTKTHSLPASAPSQDVAVPDPDSLTAIAPFWILDVRAQVESKPELIQSGQDRLAQTQQRLLGVFEFKSFDRRAFDTRDMAAPRN